MGKVVEFPPVELVTPDVAGLSADDYRAVRNPDSGHVWAMASKKYKLVKHEEVLENIEGLLHGNVVFGDFKRSIRFAHDGGRMRARYTFPNEEVAIDNGDVVNPTLEVFNSYDLSWRHTVMLGAFRLVCTNGLVVGTKFAFFRKRHMPDLYLEDVKDAMSKGLSTMQEQTKTWKSWLNRPLLPDEYTKVVKKLQLNKKERGLLEEEPETATRMSLSRWESLLDMEYKQEAAQMNWWVFFNILTQFTTHRIKSEDRRVQLEERMRTALYAA